MSISKVLLTPMATLIKGVKPSKPLSASLMKEEWVTFNFLTQI